MAAKNTRNTSNKNRPSNYVIFTLRAIADGESKFSQSGKPWAHLRAFLSQGKDQATGEYKPSIFFDVKAFSKDENMTPVVTALANTANKTYFTVKGNLAMEEWTGDDGTKHQKMVIFALSVEPFSFDENAGAAADEDLDGEPA